MFKQHLLQVNERIESAAHKSGRRLSDIMLVAVSKTVGVDVVQEAFLAGQADFGENRVPDLIYKQSEFPAANWHMIGHLQTNKIKELITSHNQPYLIHSLDRWHLADELNKRGQALGITINTLLQVNVAQEPQKSGLDMSEVQAFLESSRQFKHIRIMGLMTMAPIVNDNEEVRPVFRALAELKENINKQNIPRITLKHLSMGMSQDFEIAIEEGSDMIRVGSALFQP